MRTYCTKPEHRDGEHSVDCIPPAEPDNPELRLIRAIWGLCPECDLTEPHVHVCPLCGSTEPHVHEKM